MLVAMGAATAVMVAVASSCCCRRVECGKRIAGRHVMDTRLRVQGGTSAHGSGEDCLALFYRSIGSARCCSSLRRQYPDLAALALRGVQRWIAYVAEDGVGRLAEYRSTGSSERFHKSSSELCFVLNIASPERASFTRQGTPALRPAAMSVACRAPHLRIATP